MERKANAGLWPLRLEKVAQQCRRLNFANASHYFGTVMAGRCFENPNAMIYAAALRIVSAENQAPYAEQADGVRAHRARLKRDKEVAVGQAWATSKAGGGTQGEDFGVRRGVVIRFGAVAGACEDAAVGPKDDGADGNLAAGEGGPGFVQRCLHRVRGHG